MSAPDAVKAAAPAAAECNQLILLLNSGRYVELERRSRLLVEQYPESGFAWKILGASLGAQGKDALPALRRVVELSPDDPEGYRNLGNAMLASGRFDEAVASYLRAVKLKPDFADAYNNLGIAQQNLGRLDDALACYRRALEIKPDFFGALGNLGIAQQSLGQLDEAVITYRRALEIKPDFFGALSNLGTALQKLGRVNEAVTFYRRALEIRPDFAEAYSNIGHALRDIGQFDDAIASCYRALEIKPNFAEAHVNLGNIFFDLGRFHDGVKSYQRALEIKSDFVAHSNLLLCYNYFPDPSPEKLLDEARNYGRLVALQAVPYENWPNACDPERRLRVGLVSGRFRNCPVNYFLEGVLAAMAANESSLLEFYAYSNTLNPDAGTEKLKSYFRKWYSAVGISDAALAKRIRDDEIDILIDLSGHSPDNRLPMFAWKPAPVQASWLDSFATTGVAAMDYLIADSWVVPESEEAHFTEEIWRLPGTYLCFTPPDADVQVLPLPALSSGHITFGCFNNLTKINDAVVALWSRVLQAVPGSLLLLKAQQLGDDAVRKNVASRFEIHGIDANRLILEGPSPRAEMLAVYHKVDIALDPFPYPGGTTSLEGLWMGVPVITKRGNRFISHVGETIAYNTGLPGWIAADEDDYVAKAVAYAADLDTLARLRAGLRQQVLASPIFDAPRFARNFEAALRGMWIRWCNPQRGEGV